MKEEGYEPILLIVRNDNLAAALKACEVGGWSIYTGEDTFKFITNESSFDLLDFMKNEANSYNINRKPKTP